MLTNFVNLPVRLILHTSRHLLNWGCTLTRTSVPCWSAELQDPLGPGAVGRIAQEEVPRRRRKPDTGDLKEAAQILAVFLQTVRTLQVL